MARSAVTATIYRRATDAGNADEIGIDTEDRATHRGFRRHSNAWKLERHLQVEASALDYLIVLEKQRAGGV